MLACVSDLFRASVMAGKSAIWLEAVLDAALWKVSQLPTRPELLYLMWNSKLQHHRDKKHVAHV